jgi:hypothetical protein
MWMGFRWNIYCVHPIVKSCPCFEQQKIDTCVWSLSIGDVSHMRSDHTVYNQHIIYCEKNNAKATWNINSSLHYSYYSNQQTIFYKYVSY